MTELATRAADLRTTPRRIAVGDVAVAYRRAGSGEPILFLHGYEFTRMWLPVHGALAERADVIAPEHPGFGDTAMPPWVHGLDDVVLHYRDVIAAFGFDGVHVVGYCLGGWIAADLAIWFPHLVRSLTLIAPAGLRVPGHPIADVFGVAPGAMARLLFGDRADRFVDYFDVDPDQDEFVFRYGQLAAAARLAWSPRYDVRLNHRLRQLSLPALVIGAEHDRIYPVAHAERYAELIPGARLEVVPDASHGVIVEQPESVASSVTTFVDGVAR